MDTSVNPKISYGVTIPYTQNLIEEKGTWSNDGKIYTVIMKSIIMQPMGSIELECKMLGDEWKIPIED